MKKLFTLLSALQVVFFIFNASAQVNQWIWLRGSNTPNAAEVLGTQGVPGNNNQPPSVYEPCEWRDTAGNFWLFGGKDNTGAFYNDLWRYNPTLNQWTWMKGSGNTNDPGVYGAKGIPSLNNYPPSVGFGVPTWTDLNNNLWLFGGGGGAGSNTDDLWRYSIATNEWTWMKGDGIDSMLARGVYGTLQVPDTANHPGMRSETAATWTDGSGNLWFFGGAGYYGSMNDVWRYTIATNIWTWMKGTSQGFQWAKYGTLGVEKSTNTPSGRYVYCHWKDKSGNFWLFGGYDGTTSQYNDMWRYNPVTNNWTWMSGTDILYTQGSASAKCSFAQTNVPYSRWENRACWTDAQGNFWLFGGAIAGGNAFSTTWNNLWKFCVDANQWVWVSGDTAANATGNWGVKGVSSATNIPNGRAGDVGWSDMKGHFYIYGGTTAPFGNMYNDLWKYTVDTTCGVCQSVVLPLASFQSSDTVICENVCITFTNLSSNSTSWSWSFPGGMPSTSTDQNPFVCYFDSGNYDVRLIASNSFANDTLTVTNFIKVNVAPAPPNLTPSNDTIYGSFDSSYYSYQWYDSTLLVPNATNSYYVFNHTGNYNLSVSNKIGCSSATGIYVIFTGLQSFEYNPPFSVSPVPASEQLALTGGWKGLAGIYIYNMLGEKVAERQVLLGDRNEVNIKNLSAGVYFIKVQNDRGSWTGRFIKE